MKKFCISLGILATLLLSASAYAAPLIVYDMGDGLINGAMDKLGYSYDLRNAATPVTTEDLATHKALIVGWNAGGNSSGLNSSVLSNISGNAIITGHDPDFHYYLSDNNSAGTFLKNAIGFASSADSIGLVALSDFTTLYNWLPSNWGISANVMHADMVSSITADGLASGVYAGLTNDDMSNWGNSYHNFFVSPSSEFKAFELSGDNIVTLARTTPTPLPAAIWIFGSGIAGLAGLRRRKKKTV